MSASQTTNASAMSPPPTQPREGPQPLPLVPGEENLTPLQRRRLQDRREWDAYWKIRWIDAEGKIFPTMRYYVQRACDMPATWVREKIIEPINDKYRMPYYHRKLTRVPDIDQCGVNDFTCIYEAQEQYRLDKIVDTYIINILQERITRCLNAHMPYIQPCGPVLEDYEEAELNWFIKYGELGAETDAVDVLMKQKHRMIWERRHPEIMAERERKLKEHKEELRKGNYDHSFWKKGMAWMDKKNFPPPYEFQPDKAPWEGDQPLSKDWQYYKKVSQDPEFDKEQGKKSGVRYF